MLQKYNIYLFEIYRYNEQVEQLFQCNINCRSSIPYLTEQLESYVAKAMSMKINSKLPFEQLKEFSIDVDCLN